jgi:hypothetical protein
MDAPFAATLGFGAFPFEAGLAGWTVFGSSRAALGDFAGAWTFDTESACTARVGLVFILVVDSALFAAEALVSAGCWLEVLVAGCLS